MGTLFKMHYHFIARCTLIAQARGSTDAVARHVSFAHIISMTLGVSSP